MPYQQQVLEKKPTKHLQNAAIQWLRNYLKATESPGQLESKRPKRERRGYIIPTATIVITNPNTNTQHASFSLSPYPRNPRSGLVGLGGALESGELPQEALSREIKEEIAEWLGYLRRPDVFNPFVFDPSITSITRRLFLFPQSPDITPTRNKEAALTDFAFIVPQKYMRLTEVPHQELSLYMPPFEDNTRLDTRLEQVLNSNKQLSKRLKYLADLVSLALIALKEKGEVKRLPEQVIFYTPEGLDVYLTFHAPTQQKLQTIHIKAEKDTTGNYQFNTETLPEETAEYIKQLKTVIPLLRYLPEHSEARKLLLKFWGTTTPLIKNSISYDIPDDWEPSPEKWQLLRHLAVTTVLEVFKARLEHKANQLPPEKQEQVKNKLNQFINLLEQETINPKEKTVNGHTLRDTFSNMHSFFNTQPGQTSIQDADNRAKAFLRSLHQEAVGIHSNDFAAERNIMLQLLEQNLAKKEPIDFLLVDSEEVANDIDYYSHLYAFYLLQLAWMFLNPMHEVTKQLLPVFAGIYPETGGPRTPGSTQVPPIIQETAQLLFAKFPSSYN